MVSPLSASISNRLKVFLNETFGPEFDSSKFVGHGEPPLRALLA